MKLNCKILYANINFNLSVRLRGEVHITSHYVYYVKGKITSMFLI